MKDNLIPVYDSVSQLPPGFLTSCRVMPAPNRVLMCPPDSFDVIDEKNPHMRDQIGRVDRVLARRQWDALVGVLREIGLQVDFVAPEPNCEDMVFCANQALTGLDARGAPAAVLSRMKHASRQREVPAFERWLREAGSRLVPAPRVGFEGGGDGVWQPGRALLWGGWGHRSDPRAYEDVAAAFEVPVLRLQLTSPHFYHLDTCFCALDEHSVLVHRASLSPQGLALIELVFERVFEAPDEEAVGQLACNAVAAAPHVIVPAGAVQTRALLRDAGYQVHAIDLSEYHKSGGSAYCMKQFLFSQC